MDNIYMKHAISAHLALFRDRAVGRDESGSRRAVAVAKHYSRDARSLRRNAHARRVGLKTNGGIQ